MNPVIKDPEYPIEYTVFPVETSEFVVIEGKRYTLTSSRDYRIFSRAMTSGTAQWERCYSAYNAQLIPPFDDMHSAREFLEANIDAII